MSKAEEIFIVESNIAESEYLKHILEQHEYKVTILNNGETALQTIRERIPQIIISGVILPEMDGYQLCREIKADEQFKIIPFILLTSLSDSIDIIHGMSCGADNFITKPYDEKLLISRIEYILLNRKLRMSGTAEVGVEVILGGEKYSITPERQQIVDLLISTYETAVQKNIELQRVQEELNNLNKDLEEKVKERTAQLAEEIIERKQTEQLRIESEEKYRDLVESSPGIVYRNQPHPPYSTIYVSPNIKTFGYSPEEWQNTPDMWLSLLHNEDRERILREYKDAWHKGAETELEYRLTARNGDVYWLTDKGRFILDEQGNRLYWQGIILDITETKDLEQKLRQAQKLESVGLLAGGIAHDFNNMLTAINGYSDLTLRQLKPDDPLRRNLTEIKKAGLHSADLTQQLLAFSRQQVLQPLVIDLNHIITDTIKILQRLIGEDIELTTTLSPKIGQVKVDPGQFSQIIMNLAVNARDAMPQGGKLTIETANIFLDPIYTSQHIGVLPGAYVLLAVSDNGMGMNNETKRHIFEPFFTTKELGRGTGLGLATVYGIVKQSGGSIEVYSELGVGTTFKIYLPRVAELADPPRVSDILIEMPEGTETILLVEDEELVRNLSKEILETCGYTVLEAQDGEEALLICDRNYHIDLLMTDVVMPNMGGRQLAIELMKKLPELPILFTSGYTDDAVVRHGVIEANTNFIQKPYTPEALARIIRRILDNSHKS